MFIKIKLIIFIIFVFSPTLAKENIEILKIYNLYSKKILNEQQLETSLSKLNLNTQEIKDLFYLREQGILSEDDFEKSLSVITVDNYDQSTSEKVENSNANNNIDKKNENLLDGEYLFQTKITKLSQYVTGVKLDDIIDNIFIFKDDKLTMIDAKQNNNPIFKFNKPRLKIINESRFSIKSNVIDLSEPSAPISYKFLGSIENNRIIGKIEIRYTGNQLPPGTIMVEAETF